MYVMPYNKERNSNPFQLKQRVVPQSSSELGLPPLENAAVFALAKWRKTERKQ